MSVTIGMRPPIIIYTGRTSTAFGYVVTYHCHFVLRFPLFLFIILCFCLYSHIVSVPFAFCTSIHRLIGLYIY
jgi:hypothetical protein